MTKTTKLWISPALELRHNIKGWPKSEDYVTVCDGGQHGAFDDEGYQKALAKAKEDSILIVSQNIIKRLLLDSVNWHACDIESSFPIKFKQDTFIDFECELEVKTQYQLLGSGLWVDSMIESDSTVNDTRQVARLKPVTDARIRELEQDNAEGFEKYQDLLIQNRNLKERVKELEAWKESQMNVWGPVIDFAQSNNLHINRDMLNGLNDKLPV